MNKKFLATAVLSLACGVAVGGLSGCSGGNQPSEHVHSYTVWQYDDDGHWKKCADDDAVTEETAHSFNANNECECGYVREPEVKYGSAHAIVHLVKGTETVTDYSDVTIRIDDSDVEVSFNKITGELALTRLVAGKNYTLEINKPDYVPYSVVVCVDEEEDVAIGGSEGIVIRYDLVSMVYTIANGAGYEVTLNEGETVVETKTVGADNTVTFEGLSSKKQYTLSAKMLNKIIVSDSVNINAEGAAAVDLGLVPLSIQKTVNNTGADAQYLVDAKDHEDALIEGECYIAANIKINAETEDAAKGVRVSMYTRFRGESRGESLSVHCQPNDGWMIQQLQTWQNVKLSPEQVGMISNGATVVMHRSANGELTMYFGSDSDNFVLLGKVFNSSAFYANPIEQWGVIIHKEGSADVEVSNLRYGATLGEALNVNVPVSIVNPSVENGRVVVTGSKKYDNFVLDIQPDEDCVLKSIAINGNDATNLVKDGKIVLDAYKGETLTILPVFEKIIYGTFENVSVGGRKADTGFTALENGTVVTLKNETLGTYTFDAADGKIAGRVPVGTYIASIADTAYMTSQVTVTEDGIASAIELPYKFMTASGTHGWGAAELDISHSSDADPYVRINNASLMCLTTDKYDDVAFTLKVDRSKSTGRQSIWMHFEGDVDKTYLKLMCNDGGNNKISWWSGTSGWGNAIAANPTGDIMVCDKTTYDLTMARSGREIRIFVDGTLVAKELLPEEYAAKKCQVGINASGVKNPADFHYSVTTDLTNYSIPEVQVNNIPAEHGTVEVLSGSRLLDTFVIKATPEEGYVIKSLCINGVDKTSDLNNGELTLAKYNESTMTITAEFVSASSVSVSASIKGLRSGSDVAFADGTVIRFTSATLGYCDLVVHNGTVSGELEIGSYSAIVITAPYAGNYAAAQVVVTTEGITSDIVLNYNFAMSKTGTVGWGNADFSHLADEQPYVAITNGSADSLMTLTTNFYDSVVYTLKVDKTNSGNGRQGIWMYFEGDTAKTFLKVAYNDGNNGRVIWWTGNSAWGNAISASPTGDIMTPTKTVFDLTVVRAGAVVAVYVDGILAGTANLPTPYAEKKCKVGVFAAAAANAKFYTEFTTDVSAYTED